MNITQPITPGDDRVVFNEYDLDNMIQKLNQDISQRKWHYQHFPLKDEGGEWNAVIIHIGIKKDLMDKVVEIFKSVGWDCKFQDAYDGRGPHQCFYVNKKHFND